MGAFLVLSSLDGRAHGTFDPSSFTVGRKGGREGGREGRGEGWSE